MNGNINFDNYRQAQEYVKKCVKKEGKKYYCSEEYKALYPVLQELHKTESLTHKELAKQVMSEADVKPGDRVIYDHISSFFTVEVYTGRVFMKNGTPFVKLDKPKMNGTTTTKWHKGFRKLV